MKGCHVGTVGKAQDLERENRRPDGVVVDDVKLLVAQKFRQASAFLSKCDGDFEMGAVEIDATALAEGDDPMPASIFGRTGIGCNDRRLMAEPGQRRGDIPDVILYAAGPIDIVGADERDLHRRRRKIINWVRRKSAAE